jgi:hypothetical protein
VGVRGAGKEAIRREGWEKWRDRTMMGSEHRSYHSITFSHTHTLSLSLRPLSPSLHARLSLTLSSRLLLSPPPSLPCSRMWMRWRCLPWSSATPSPPAASRSPTPRPSAWSTLRTTAPAWAAAGLPRRREAAWPATCLPTTVCMEARGRGAAAWWVGLWVQMFFCCSCCMIGRGVCMYVHACMHGLGVGFF